MITRHFIHYKFTKKISFSDNTARSLFNISNLTYFYLRQSQFFRDSAVEIVHIIWTLMEMYLKKAYTINILFYSQKIAQRFYLCHKCIGIFF